MKKATRYFNITRIRNSLLEKDEIDVSTSEPSADDGWNMVHGKRARTSVKKRDHMTTSNKVVIMSNNLIK